MDMTRFVSLADSTTRSLRLTIKKGIIAGILVSEQFLDTFPIIRRPVIEGTFTSIFSVRPVSGHHTVVPRLTDAAR